MPCFHPMPAWQSPEGGPLHFPRSARGAPGSMREGSGWRYLEVPCGQCVGCRLNRSAQWALRMENEASQYEKNCFLSLTYDDKSLPKDLSLNKKHFQDFMKRFRDFYDYPEIKFYHCGEYGPLNQRPHYHACIFNFDFEDKELFKEYDVPGCSDPIRLFTSQSLSERWGHGFCTIGEVTWESAAYCARYVVDKITGPKAEAHYNGRLPEYSTMSKGIGRKWFEQFQQDLYPNDYAVSRGHKVKVPRYYDKLLEEKEPLTFQKIKAQRALEIHAESDRRLADREEVQLQRLELLKRVLP